jgi:hypothetical protein
MIFDDDGCEHGKCQTSDSNFRFILRKGSGCKRRCGEHGAQSDDTPGEPDHNYFLQQVGEVDPSIADKMATFVRKQTTGQRISINSLAAA